MAMLLSIAVVVPCHADLLERFHQAMLALINVGPCRTRADAPAHLDQQGRYMTQRSL